MIAALVVALLPAAAESAERKGAANSTFMLFAKLPASGKIGLLHAVLEVKRPKGRKGKLRFRARLLDKAKLPRTAFVLLRVSALKGKRDTFAADLIVANAKAAAAARAGPGGRFAQDFGSVAVGLTAGTANRGAVGFPGGRIRGVIGDYDVAGPDPDRPLCGPSGDFNRGGAVYLVSELFDPSGIAKPGTGEEVTGVVQKLACDEQVGDELLRSLASWLARFDGLDALTGPAPPATTPGPTCTGSLFLAPPPHNTTEFEIEESCTADKTSIGFLMPDGTTIAPNGFLPITPHITTCTIESRGAGTNNFLLCQGAQPAGTAGRVRVHPVPGNPCGKIVRIFPGGGPFGDLAAVPAVPTTPAFDTDAFATCP